MSLSAHNAQVSYRGGTIAIINGKVYRGLPTHCHLRVDGDAVHVNGDLLPPSTETSTPGLVLDGDGKVGDIVATGGARVGFGNVTINASDLRPGDLLKFLRGE